MKIDPKAVYAPEVQVTTPAFSEDATAAPLTGNVQKVSSSGAVEGTVSAGKLDAKKLKVEFGKTESALAAVAQWSPGSVFEYAFGPTFEPEQGYQAGNFMLGVKFPLQDAEQKYLQGAVSLEDSQYRYDRLLKQRKLQGVMADNPITSMVAAGLDPGYLAIDAATLGSQRIAQMGRLATAATAGTGAVALGVVEQQVKPMAASDIVLNALANAGATALFYSGGKLQKLDPEYPNVEIKESAQMTNPDNGLAMRTAFSAPDVQAPRTGRELADELDRAFAGTEFEDIVQAIKAAPELDKIKVSTAKELQDLSPNSRGFWARQWKDKDTLSGVTGQRGPQSMMFVRENAHADVGLHELAHAVLENRLHSNPALKAEMQTIQQDVLGTFRQMYQAAKAAGDEKALSDIKFMHSQMKDFGEFVAYSMTSPTFQKWTKGKTIGTRQQAEGAKPLTLWDKLADLFSRVLGMGRPRYERLLEATARNDARVRRNAMRDTPLDARLKQIAKELTSDGVEADLLGTQSVKFQSNLDITAAKAAAKPYVDNIRDAVEKMDKSPENVGRKISWSYHKSMAQLSSVGKEVADTLLDDPLDMTSNSATSQMRAIRADLSAFQYKYEDLLKEELAARGAGLKNRILSKDARRVQEQLEKEVGLEMLARASATQRGVVHNSTAKPAVQKLADALDAAAKAGLDELKRAGVQGAEELTEKSGYFSRRWDVTKQESALNRLKAGGLSDKEAKSRLTDLLSESLRRANGWDATLSRDVAGAMVDRTHRKGYFEDTAFRSHYGKEAAAEVRDILERSGLPADRVQRALDVITGVVDEAGKAPILKRRVEMDMFHSIVMPNGSELAVHDLIDMNMTRITDRYLDTVAGQSALARKGLPTSSEIAALRTKYLEGIPTEANRAEGAKLFDGAIDILMGRPVGEQIPELMRNIQGLNRMISLGSSGFWQVTEFAPLMARYGGKKVLDALFKAHPDAESFFTGVFKDKGAATELQNILTRNAAQDVRIRPYIQKMEDNFEIPMSSQLQLALQQAEQLVPYINGMKFVQQHQARVASNLILETVNKAARGDVRAVAALEKYGLESSSMLKIANNIKQFGTDTAKWSDGTWDALRGPITKMMDDTVLRARAGELPAFAQLSAVGKFIFTFRSFILAAHNKILAGGLTREGYGGVALVMMYQLPLSMMATAAAMSIQGKPPENTHDWAMRSINQMGALGLFSDLFGVISGQKNQFGAPGLIAIDRLYRFGGEIGQGDVGGASAVLINSLPIISIIPGVKAIGESLKGD